MASPLLYCLAAAALAIGALVPTSEAWRPTATTPPLPVLPIPSAAQLKWQRREVIMFFHFGMNTFTGSEWGTGTEDPSLFRPAALDAAQWVGAARAAGASLAILVAKHHDGFCLWPSAYMDHSVRASPWRAGRGDVVREFVRAARAGGVDAGLYLSPWDRHDARYGKEVAYSEYYEAQLHELLTGSVRERVGDLVRRRQGQERDQHDVPLPGVVPDGEAAAALHQHLLRRRARRPVGRRREGIRRNHLLVHRQPLHDHHRRGRHREVTERGRPAGARLGAAGVRLVDPAGLVLAQERDGQAAEPAAGDLLQLRRPELRAPAERAAQLHGPGRGRGRRAAARVRLRRGHHLRHEPRGRQRRQGQQRARRRVSGAQRARRAGRHVLGADGGGRAPERVLDRAAAAAGVGGPAVQRGADPGARRAGAARGAARGVRGRRARGERHDGRAQAAAPAAPRRRGRDGAGLDRGAAGPAAAVRRGAPPRPLRRGGLVVTWRSARPRGGRDGMHHWCRPDQASGAATTGGARRHLQRAASRRGKRRADPFGWIDLLRDE